MAEAARRTVIIRGQVVDRYSPRRSTAEPDAVERRARRDSVSPGYRPRHASADRPERPRRPAGYDPRRPHASSRRRRPYDPPRARPDRIALWAVLLGVVLLLAAATSSHAAVLAHVLAR